MPKRSPGRLTSAIRSLVGTADLSERIALLQHALGAANGAGLQAETAPAPAASAVPVIDVNLLLHQCRGALLRGMPKISGRLLSAGCAGTWYFHWIEEKYGKVAEHLGIEYYMPRPDDLPANVVWIENTVSDMSAVADRSCDLVFSGQNLEHLWPEEVSGFALEAARVLKPGGHLVVDSPNRLITAPLNWSHPEHTIELTEAEARHLLELAGFDITASYGIWLCRDPESGAILPFDPNLPSGDWSLAERILVARDKPSDSFIWWLEAVRADREPDAAGARAYMDELFAAHWPERIQRLLSLPGHEVRSAPEGDWIVSAPGHESVPLYGPYMPLKAGRYRISWRLQPQPGATAAVALCDVVARDIEGPLARTEVKAGDSRVSLEFDIPTMTFGLQYRVLSTGGAGFSVLREVELEKIG